MRERKWAGGSSPLWSVETGSNVINSCSHFLLSTSSLVCFLFLLSLKMKRPSVFVLLGLCVLLLSGLTICAVMSVLTPSPWIRPLLRLLVFAPFFVSTLLMTSLLSKNAGCLTLVSMETAQPAEGAAGLDEDYDDITAEVITEYVF